jgi:hypothetical protein
MNKLIKSSLIATVISVFALTAHAAKPVNNQGVPFGNGFPSGKHFNLNIIGKKDNFSCPAPDIDPETGIQTYGNVVFIPRNQGNDPITILMESGKKGPKGAQNAVNLEVTDWCSESFADFNQNKGDSAVLRLPKNDNGYGVYARITGKPGEDGEPKATIAPELFYVEDEAGNELILLGLVDRDGTATFSSDGMTLTRTSTDTSTKGKGVQKATNVTALFEWTGEVCYVQEDSYLYCLDDFGNNTCTSLDLCCVDKEADGIHERCDLLTEVAELTYGNTLQCPADYSDGTVTYPYLPMEAQCQSYDNEWVFNIADFVGYLWDLDTTGSYVIQVRFYPL